MATETIITQENPDIEAYRLGLLESARDLASIDEGEDPISLPDYQVSDLSDEQLLAAAAAQSGIGSYIPFLQDADATIGTGITTLEGAVGAYNPELAEDFMNPYQSLVIDEMTKELNRQQELELQKIQSQAMQAGAYGGSRSAVAEALQKRNMQDLYAKNVADLLSSGYTQAQNASMQAFEDASNRALQTGQALGTLGLQTAGIGELEAALNTQDINNLMLTGGMTYEQAQAELEAKRMSELQNIYEPFQRVSFLSDIYQGTPSSQQVISTSTDPSASPFQQVAGLGIAGLTAAAGASKAGII